MKSSEIITIGDELLIGQVVNTNAAWLGEQLFTLGIPVRHSVTVGDGIVEICCAMDAALKRSDVILVTGGLGPTHDDVTRTAVCSYFETDLVEDPAVLATITAMFERRGMPLTESNRGQALVPRSATVIPNLHGTAPGLRFERDGKLLFITPGVPREMHGIFHDAIRPMLEGWSGAGVVTRTLVTAGIAESFLSEKIGPVPDVVNGLGKLAFLPGTQGVRLRITVESSIQYDADAIALRMENHIRERAADFIFGTGTDTLESVIGKLLKDRKFTLAVAESCTGGSIANAITNIAGSSEYFLRGYVTYSNASKIELLDVSPDELETRGAVSMETAEAMAEGARLKSGADIAVSTTGIAGSGGGTDQKPVGLVYIGISDAMATVAYKFVFGTDRVTNKERFASTALYLLWRRLLRLT